MYHFLYNGWNSDHQVRAGVAIRNSNSTSCTITYKGASIGVDTGEASIGLTNTPTVLKNFFDASPQTVTIPANGTSFVYGITTNFVKGKGKFVFVRAQFKASLSSNVWMRVFVAGQNKMSSVNDLLNFRSLIFRTKP